MNFYYGLVDIENMAYGFLEDNDPRITTDMILITEEYHDQLIEEQSEGKEIVFYEGEVFATEEIGRYFIDSNGRWQCKTDEDYYQEIVQRTKEYIVNKLYEIKAKKAYGGVIINDLLVFETNQVSITSTVSSLSLMKDDAVANWKFYTLKGEPYMQVISKSQLYAIAQFGRDMIDNSFLVEGEYNKLLKETEFENLKNPEWVNSFIEAAQQKMDAVNNKMFVNLV